MLNRKIYTQVLVLFFIIIIDVNIKVVFGQEINVCAIPQLYSLLNDIKIKYKVKNPKTNINYYFNTATDIYAAVANNELLCDLYLGNDTKFPAKYVEINKGKKNSLIVFTSSPLVLFSLSYILHKDCDFLDEKQIKVFAITDPKVQVSGYESIEFLKNLNINMKKFKNKLLLGANEYQTLSFVINGNASMGILPYNLLKNNSMSYSGSMCFLPPNTYTPIYYYALNMSNNVQKDLMVNEYIAFLLSIKENKNSLYKKHGFN